VRIMVLGSVTQGVDNKARDFQEFCRRLGAAARQRGHSAAVCSLFPNSADLAFLEGMAEAAPTSRGADATVFFPADTENEDRFHAVKSKIPFQLQACPVYAIQPSAGRSYAFLQCQLMALDSCDIVVAVGGNRDGSAPMLLRLAEFKRKAIVPVTAFDGAASDYYHANRVQFLRQYEVLSRRERADDIISLATPEATRPGHSPANSTANGPIRHLGLCAGSLHLNAPPRARRRCARPARWHRRAVLRNGEPYKSASSATPARPSAPGHGPFVHYQFVSVHVGRFGVSRARHRRR
jgi:hypothetical protein